jgi:GNAT superfamily N-acetyltransferase
MPGIEISPVNTAAAKRQFLEFPYGLYRDDPNWVAPLRIDQKEILDPSRHPFYKHADMHCFLATSSGAVCGRIAAIVDRDANAARNERVGTFGFFESIDSSDVAAALFASARAWLSARGMTLLRGPMNPSINYEAGLLVDGFDSTPRVMVTYNPPYYERLFLGAGLHSVRDLYAYRLTRRSPEGERQRWSKLERALRMVSNPDAIIRPVKMNQFDADVQGVWRIYNEAWRGNWGAAPCSPDELRYIARQLKPIMIPELAVGAEAGGQLIGFAIAVPDINQALKHAHGSLFPFGLLKILYYRRGIKSLRVVALGVLEQYRDTGIAARLYAAIYRKSLELGYTEAECSWVVEDNRPMRKSLEFLGGERYKTYRIYEAPLETRPN